MSLTATSELQHILTAFRRERSDAVPILVDEVLSLATRLNASDIHLEPNPRGIDVRFRLDGVLQSAGTLPGDLASVIVARLKVMSELLTYRTDIPQEGRIRRFADERKAAIRLSVFPTIHGEKAVLRVFESDGDLREFHHLGFPTALVDTLSNLLDRRSGALLLTGPSGSGKTTTIYACLRRLATSGRHIVTLEDPVEQIVDGISQSHVKPGTEFDFARGLRSVLRQDPEVLMIGEIRDRETASIAFEAALTGHLIVSTLHAGSACGVIGRLLDMGIEPYVLTSGLLGVVNQRLARKSCPNCKNGCSACAGTGYKGRILLAEILTLDDSLRRAILAKADAHELESAGATRLKLRLAADDAMAQGMTTPDEIRRVFGSP